MITTVEAVAKYFRMEGVEAALDTERIEFLIALAEDDYLRIRNKAFDTTVDPVTLQESIVYPVGSERTAILMVAWMEKESSRSGIGVKAESLGDWSVTYGDSMNGYPDSITKSIKRYVTFV